MKMKKVVLRSTLALPFAGLLFILAGLAQSPAWAQPNPCPGCPPCTNCPPAPFLAAFRRHTRRAPATNQPGFVRASATGARQDLLQPPFLLTTI